MQPKYKGKQWQFKIIIKNKTTGGFVDITNAIVWFALKNRLNDADENAEIFVKKNPPHSDPINGTTTLVIDPTTTSEISVGRKYYSFQFIMPDGSGGIISQGEVLINQPGINANS